MYGHTSRSAPGVVVRLRNNHHSGAIVVLAHSFIGQALRGPLSTLAAALEWQYHLLS